MKTKKVGINLTGRLETGAAILAAARTVDTTLVKGRLAAFASAQRSYVEAQRQVEAADATLREGQVRLARCDVEQDEAVEGLACALVTGGQPRRKPFIAFGIESPSTVKQMPVAAKAKAIHQLAAAVRGHKRAGRAALQAAQAADQAAQRTEAALLAVVKFQAALNTSRLAREGIGKTWTTTLGALKLGVRYDAAAGAPGLYAALFGRTSRSRKKVITPAPPAPTPLAPAPDVIVPTA